MVNYQNKSQYMLSFDDDYEPARMDAMLTPIHARVIHRITARKVLIVTDMTRSALQQSLPTGVSLDSGSQSRSRSESELLVNATHLRLSSQFAEAKSRRRDDGREWGDGDFEAPGHDESATDSEHIHRSRSGVSGAVEFIAPINDRLVNDTAVSLIIVDGTHEFSMSEEEKTNIAAEVMTGLDWLASVEEDANVSWSYKVETPTVNVDPWSGARWPGMPANFYNGIDAAVVREDNDKLYFFKGSQYVRFSNVSAGVDPGYPKAIEGNWPGLPTTFNQGIDAALWRQSNGVLYLFKGSSYVRFTNVSEGVDSGYPKSISGNWPDLPSSFTSGIDAALMRKDNGKIYFFKDDQYVRFSRVSAGVDAGYPKPLEGNWSALPDSYTKGINAALWRDSNGATYFFQNKRNNGRLYGTYVRFSNISNGVDSGYMQGKPIGLSTGEAERLWRNPAMASLGYGEGSDQVRHLAADVRDSLRAQHGFCLFVTKYPTTHFAYAGGGRIVYRKAGFLPTQTGNMDRVIAHETGHVFGAPDEYGSSGCRCSTKSGRFFKASNRNCANCDPDENAPCIMRSNSPGLCQNTPWHLGWGAFMTGIDAAFWRHDVNKAYLFSGTQYIRYSTISNGRDEGYPKKIAGNWPGLPVMFRSGIDAALWRKDNNKLYFFKENQYVRFSSISDGVDSGYPRTISGNWPGLPANFNNGIDAAFWREDNDKIYFFKGSQYVRFSNISDGVDVGYPRSISGNWPGLTTDFNSGIDAALMRPDNNKLYFFSGSRYSRFSNISEGIDSGYPRYINGVWMSFPRHRAILSSNDRSIQTALRGSITVNQTS